MLTDPIADYLTRVRNAVSAKKYVVEIPASKVKKGITEILYDQGYILNYAYDETKNHQGSIKIALKYDKRTKEPAIRKIVRVSKPGLRNYSSAQDLPDIINGLGIYIVSTSKGILTDKEARKQNVGGELLCYVY